MLAAAALVAAAVGAVALLGTGGNGPDAATSLNRPRPSSSSAPSTTGPEPATTIGPPVTTPGPAPPGAEPDVISGDEVPVRLAVPAIGFDAPVILLGLNPDDSLDVPSTAQDTGWWSGGSVPGTPGPAVIAGHINLDGEPGVFAELGRLDPGDDVRVRLDVGQEVSYRVDRVERYAKEAFPTNDVYGPTDEPELRLITCGGAFDPATGHYRDNVIAFATLVA